MKNDINIIKNELIEQTNNIKEKRKEEKQQKTLSFLKEEISGTIKDIFTYDDIFTNDKLNDIYKQRDTIIDDITSIFYNMTETRLVSNDWILTHTYTKKEEKLFYDGKLTEKVRIYDYPCSVIGALVRNEFLKQYRQFKSELKEEHLILKNDLQKKLKERFIDIIENDTPSECSYLSMIKSLSLIDSKDEVINEITDAEKEKSILESVYYQTLNEVKKSYINSIRYKRADKEQLALPWKIIVGYKAIGKIWKM